MGAVATLVLVGFIALALALPDITRAFGRVGSAPDTGNQDVRKVQRWTLVF